MSKSVCAADLDDGYTSYCLCSATGQHGFDGYVAGTMLLAPGLHDIEIDYFQVQQVEYLRVGVV